MGMRRRVVCNPTTNPNQKWRRRFPRTPNRSDSPIARVEHVGLLVRSTENYIGLRVVNTADAINDGDFVVHVEPCGAPFRGAFSSRGTVAASSIRFGVVPGEL